MATKELKNSEGAAELGGWLILFISGLLCLGALMVFSAGASLDQQIDLKHFWRYSTLRRVAFVPVVWLVLAVVSRCGYRRWLINERQFWLSPVVFLMGLSIVLLVLVLIPGVGTEVNSSMRWLVLGGGRYGLRFQPSELAKWITVMFIAVYGAQRQDKIREFWRGFMPVCAVLMLVVGLIGKEDFGTAVLVGACGVMVMLVGGVRWWHLLVLVPV
ncbi:MAG: FtsW/RodA/SpoVE family cell cycle protein, partial [Sedimentisphaerales bacterium]|nr:FtsW/RodA/SpoVE family cell cycle protein [Sedimentisphaerales bacterium]